MRPDICYISTTFGTLETCVHINGLSCITFLFLWFIFAENYMVWFWNVLIYEFAGCLYVISVWFIIQSI